MDNRFTIQNGNQSNSFNEFMNLLRTYLVTYSPVMHLKFTFTYLKCRYLYANKEEKGVLDLTRLKATL